MLFDGARQPGARHLIICDRWTGVEIDRVAQDGADEVDRAVTAVATARHVIAPARRSAILTAAADAVAERAAWFASLITRESGICVRETGREVARAVANLRVAAVEAERLRGETIPLPDGRRLAFTLPEPVGVVAAITPFNRPLNQVV